jgi:hypothetical protein
MQEFVYRFDRRRVEQSALRAGDPGRYSCAASALRSTHSGANRIGSVLIIGHCDNAAVFPNRNLK